jgi:hypothetical protein
MLLQLPVQTSTLKNMAWTICLSEFSSGRYNPSFHIFSALWKSNNVQCPYTRATFERWPMTTWRKSLWPGFLGAENSSCYPKWGLHPLNKVLSRCESEFMRTQANARELENSELYGKNSELRKGKTTSGCSW